MAGEGLNAAGGSSPTVNELSAVTQEILGVEIQSVCEPARVGEVERSASDIWRATRLPGYERAHSVEELMTTIGAPGCACGVRA